MKRILFNEKTEKNVVVDNKLDTLIGEDRFYSKIYYNKKHNLIYKDCSDYDTKEVFFEVINPKMLSKHLNKYNMTDNQVEELVKAIEE